MLRIIQDGMMFHPVDGDDVREAFTSTTGLDVGDMVEEFTVQTMDCELDSDADGEVARVYLYLEPLDNECVTWTTDEALDFAGWNRVSWMHSDTLGIVYERRD